MHTTVPGSSGVHAGPPAPHRPLTLPDLVRTYTKLTLKPISTGVKSNHLQRTCSRKRPQNKCSQIVGSDEGRFTACHKEVKDGL
jgi:hypothetical protein